MVREKIADSMNTIKQNYSGKGQEWKCYQYCYIREDYEKPLSEQLSFKQIKTEFLQNHPKQKAFFAQYITDFDVSEPTEWWFTIKDDAYDLSKLNSKKRYEITKAHKFCLAEEINPIECMEELFDVYKESFSAYPEKYRPKEILFEDFTKYIYKLHESENNEFYATRFIENGKLIGFLIINHKGKYIGLAQQKTNPIFEKYNSNASLIDFVLTKYNEKLKQEEVVFTNGSRSIKHETNFNAYLEKYFGFRKAYAKFRVVYCFPFGIIVKILKPFRKLLEHSNNPFLYNIYCVLKMDSFANK
ncbi:MAG: hypothetical protein K5907_08640 [Treponema sp.]|nr:hypothetical protein [Treponema sp.]